MIMTSLSKAGLYCAQRVLIQARLTGIERRTEPSHEYRSIDLTDHEIKCKAFLHHTSELWDILDRIETHPPHPVEVVCIPVCLNGQTYPELCSKRTKPEARKIAGLVCSARSGIHRSQYILSEVGLPASWQAKRRTRNGQWLLLQPRHEMSL